MSYCIENGIIYKDCTKTKIIGSKQNISNILVIPDGVTYIDEGAFANCYNLTSVTIPDSVANIGDYAFCETGLTNIIIPDSVTRIGEGAFLKCDNLKNITIPNDIIYIGRDAFGCHARLERKKDFLKKESFKSIICSFWLKIVKKLQ